MNQINLSCRVYIETKIYLPLLSYELYINSKSYLIFLFGFNVQFVSNLTYLYSSISAVWWKKLHVDFMCPKPYFYISVIKIASIILL